MPIRKHTVLRITVIFVDILFLFSCNRDNLILEETKEGNDVLVCMVPSDDDTKVSMSSDYKPLWQEGDAISVLSSDGHSAKFTLVDGAGTAKGSFRGTLPASSDGIFRALFPYNISTKIESGNIVFDIPKIQTGRTGSFANGSTVMVASFKQSSMTASFKNVMGLLRIGLSGSVKISRVIIEDVNESSCLNGNAVLRCDGTEGTDTQKFYISGGSNESELEFSTPTTVAPGTVKILYFPFAPGSLSNGFSITIYDENGEPIYSRLTEKDQTIMRSRIRVMPVIKDLKSPADNIKYDPTLWSAYNDGNRSSGAETTIIDPLNDDYPSNQNREKYVGIFYFVLHGSHGYDVPGGSGTFTKHFSFPSSSDVSSPYDVQTMLGSGNYDYSNTFSRGSMSDTYHWGEPYLGYYIANDSWVIRKHAQMLSDAGVDFIAFDVTNHYSYLDVITNISKIYLEMRKEGNNTPQIVFLLNSQPASTASDVYNGYYAAHPEFESLWFKWDEKPLILVDKSAISNTSILNFFTFRQSWYLWNSSWQTAADEGDKWWGDGEDKWPWGCCYTKNNISDGQKAGTHMGKNECASVMPATHPISNIGRSYVVGSGVTYKTGAAYAKNPGDGIYFKSQFKAANALDPQVLFFTGWNEWVATRYPAGTLGFNYMGGKKANSVLVDQYNHEYSRDIEPLKGGFGDNYYYYMVDFIRKFKGVSETPSFSAVEDIAIDGDFIDWINVESSYRDDIGDTKWRGYDSNSGNGWYGWGRYNKSTSLVNKSGRNDISICKIAAGETSINFYVSAVNELTSISSGEKGLNLYFSVAGINGGWEAFNFRLMPVSSTKAALYRTREGWNWSKVNGDIPIAVKGRSMEVSIPLSELGISNSNGYQIDFKWVDNVDMSSGEGIQKCMSDGDSAPNGRFRYRYIFK